MGVPKSTYPALELFDGCLCTVVSSVKTYRAGLSAGNIVDHAFALYGVLPAYEGCAPSLGLWFRQLEGSKGILEEDDSRRWGQIFSPFVFAEFNLVFSKSHSWANDSDQIHGESWGPWFTRRFQKSTWGHRRPWWGRNHQKNHFSLIVRIYRKKKRNGSLWKNKKPKIFLREASGIFSNC